VKDDSQEGEDRWLNVQELLGVMQKYDALAPSVSLTSFLEEVALVSEVDKLDSGTSDALTLMTLHLCKGLEFEHVIITGCEEGLFPHGNALFDKNQLEEERRIMYVGMTRAKDHLKILHATSRTLWGNTQSNPRSRFLDDLPHTVIEAKSDTFDSKYAWLGSTASPGSQWWQPSQPKPKAPVNEFNQDSGSSDDWLEHNEEVIDEGTRIVHRTMGLGTVLHRRGDIVEVRFDAGATKKLALGIAPIKVAVE
jgi:DNA helicase-2/ATP-dependent DNA helicase PcrA